MIRKFAFLMTFLLACFSLSGQKKQINYLEYGPEQTHLYSGIVGMYQDPIGYLWAFGVGGITRFDGIHFESIQAIYPDSKNLPLKNCLSLFKDDDYFWIGTRGGGLFVIDDIGKLGDFRKLLFENDQIKARIIKQIFSIQDHLFIVGETGLEIFQKVGDRFKKKEEQENIKLIHLDNETVWMSDHKNIYAYHLEEGTTKTYSNYPRASFFKDHMDRLWFSTYDQINIIYRYNKEKKDIEKNKFQPFDHARRKLNFCFSGNLELWAIESGTSAFSIASIRDEKVIPKENISSNLNQGLFLRYPFRDKGNRLWFYGNKLMQIYSKEGFSTIRFNSIKDVDYSDILVQGDFVLSGLRNSGFIVYSTKSGTEKYFTTANSLLGHNYISRIEPLQDEKIAVLQMNHFQVYDLNKGFSPAIKLKGITRSVFENETHYWVGGIRSMFKISKKDNAVQNIGTPSIFADYNNAVNEIMDFDEDHLLLATSTNGLVLLHKKSNELSELNVGTNVNVDSLQVNKILAATISPNRKHVALATDNGIKIVTLGKSIHAIDTDNYFFNNVAFQNDTILFATSNNEVVRYNLLNGALDKFDHSSGLINRKFSFRSSDTDEFGNVYLAGDNGIDVIRNKKIESQTSEFNLHVENVIFGDTIIYSPQKMTFDFSPKERHVDIKLNTPGNTEGRNIKIQENYSFDNQWTNLQSSGILSLINPKAGNTVISFRAVDQTDSLRSEVISMNLNFQQYWYQNSWFWLVAGLVFLGGIFTAAFSYQYRKNKSIQAEIKLKEELASLKLQSLTSQMNPHFIFNALSSIQQLIAEGNPKTAEDYLVKFSKLLRYVMQYATAEYVSLSEEINFIKNYIDVELLRFSDSFKYAINNDVLNVSEFQIPPFFIQPQVENAIKHGLRNKEGVGLISINIQEVNGKLQVEIRDNGIGRAAAQKLNTYSLDNTKKGMLLTRERINHLNQKNIEASIQVVDLKDDSNQAMGTSVVLIFDVINPKSKNQK